MKKRTKISLVLSSSAAILLAGSVMAGGTYALFTSESKTNIAVSSGTVDVSASISDLQAYSPTEIKSDGTISNDTNAADNTADTKVFVNKGTAALDGNKLTLTNMTPGDKVTFNIKITNHSNVAAKYRTIVSSDDGELFDGLEFKIGNDYGVAYSSWSTAESTTLDCYVELPTDAENEYQGKECNIYFTVEAVQGNANMERHFDTLEEAFNLTDNEFVSGNSHTDPINLDGKGLVYIDKWVDAWVSANLTIKGVTFVKGATINLNTYDGLVINIDNCVFNPCKQAELVHVSNNDITNSGDGMCLNLEKANASNVVYKVTNCKFIGENDESLEVYGVAYNDNGTVRTYYKKRAYGIALDAIAGGDNNGSSIKTALIKNCEISGVRGNAIQLHGKTGEITIKNTKINTWGVNKGNYYKNGSTTPSYGDSNAIRGDYDANGSRKLNLNKVYFGLAEGYQDQGEEHERYLAHVNVGVYAGNTVADNTDNDERHLKTTPRAAGTYSYIDN